MTERTAKDRIIQNALRSYEEQVEIEASIEHATANNDNASAKNMAPEDLDNYSEANEVATIGSVATQEYHFSSSVPNLETFPTLNASAKQETQGNDSVARKPSREIIYLLDSSDDESDDEIPTTKKPPDDRIYIIDIDKEDDRKPPAIELNDSLKGGEIPCVGNKKPPDWFDIDSSEHESCQYEEDESWSYQDDDADNESWSYQDDDADDEYDRKPPAIEHSGSLVEDEQNNDTNPPVDDQQKDYDDEANEEYNGREEEYAFEEICSKTSSQARKATACLSYEDSKRKRGVSNDSKRRGSNQGPKRRKATAKKNMADDYKWEVEDTVKRRTRKVGRKTIVEYLCRWKDTWQPLSSLKRRAYGYALRVNGKDFAVKKIVQKRTREDDMDECLCCWVDTWLSHDDLNNTLLMAAFKKFPNDTNADETSEDDKNADADDETNRKLMVDGVQFNSYVDYTNAKRRRNQETMINLGFLKDAKIDPVTEAEATSEDEIEETGALQDADGEEGFANAYIDSVPPLQQNEQPEVEEDRVNEESENNKDSNWGPPRDQPMGNSGDDKSIDYGTDQDSEVEQHARNADKSGQSDESDSDVYFSSRNDGMDSDDDEIDGVPDEKQYGSNLHTSLKRIGNKEYRIHECYNMEDGMKYKIKALFQVGEKAECIQYIPIKNTFVHFLFDRSPSDGSSSPSGDVFLRLGAEVTVALSSLKNRCSKNFRKFPDPWRYEHGVARNDLFRSGALFQECRSVPVFSPGKPTVLELFAGAGGMCLGWRNAGLHVKWTVEKDSVFHSTLKQNFPDIKANGNHHTMCIKRFREKCEARDPAYPRKGDVDHIHSSSPCQGFSDANRNGGRNDQENNGLSAEFIRFICLFEPTTATFENVASMTKRKHVHHLEKIVTDLYALGYQVRWSILDASDYGDPQKRKRLILWAAKIGTKLPDLPARTHGTSGQAMFEKRTVKDAIGCLEKEEPSILDPTTIYLNRANVHNHVVVGATVKDKDYHKGLLKHDKPSQTVTGALHLVHYNGQRYISVREAACLQSFPWDYSFEANNVANLYKMIGNAVPVMMATQIARSVGQVYGLP